MKPRIHLTKVWHDCGHRYEQWRCTSFFHSGYGSTPKDAYFAWMYGVGK